MTTATPQRTQRGLKLNILKRLRISVERKTRDPNIRKEIRKISRHKSPVDLRLRYNEIKKKKRKGRIKNI
jgi:hypothetical protein